MEVKRDILWRVYVCFLCIVIFSLIILGRVIYIQHGQGDYWIAQAKEQQQRVVPIEAERGTIYSEDGSMLSTSIPFFDIYIDFGADGLREKNGKRFKDNVDSLSIRLSGFFKDQSSVDYKRQLHTGYRKKDRYFLLKRNLSFQQYKVLRTFPLIRQGRNKSGFIAEVKSKRLNPFGLLANRTIGLSREFIDSEGKVKNTNVGLEKTYDNLLKGETGSRLVRYLAGGVYVPVEGYEIEPENGNDIISTIDVNIQDIAENALLRMMNENECAFGTCIVMEVKTGKIKAIANLGRRTNGTYWEDLNYAIRASEPGSTFKLATMLALLEDKHVTLTDRVNLEGGKWQVNRRTVYDSEHHGLQEVTVKQAFEHSSNVGMAKLTMNHYAKNPLQFIDHLKKLNLHKLSGIGLLGETSPIIKTPKSKTWSATSLPWMSFGYEVLVSPLQTLMLYNAVANDGAMLKPYLVSAVQKAGLVVQKNEPEILEQQICSEETLGQLKECLYGVCNEEDGTGFTLFKGSPYKVAGKTGTALVANGNRGYSDHIYQSSFAGYFPANNPRYSCIVVIKNKPFAKKYYGALVAGPVFKEVADKLYAMNAEKDSHSSYALGKDSSAYYYSGATDDLKKVMSALQIDYKDSVNKNDWSRLYAVNYNPVLNMQPVQKDFMPDVKGMGLKDALYLLENAPVKVVIKGRGKVKAQSVAPGSALSKNQTVTIELK
ncbi:MAG: transpeptidase family protein [Chitinophagaceae bacterium]|nr:transpeptidase family protein [Chitinophagaceae bacterium]